MPFAPHSVQMATSLVMLPIQLSFVKSTLTCCGFIFDCGISPRLNMPMVSPSLAASDDMYCTDLKLDAPGMF